MRFRLLNLATVVGLATLLLVLANTARAETSDATSDLVRARAVP